jgi:hypothetical protein
MNSQLLLTLGLKDSATFTSFFPGPNAVDGRSLGAGRVPLGWTGHR